MTRQKKGIKIRHIQISTPEDIVCMYLHKSSCIKLFGQYPNSPTKRFKDVKAVEARAFK